MIYIEFEFKITPKNPGLEILLATLSQFNFSTFLEEPNSIKAYVLEDEFDFNFTSASLFHNPHFKVSFSKKKIAQKNWNKKWEENFKPVKLDKTCIIKSSFHKETEGYKYEIIIDPKMAFGTGHHETTILMLQSMLTLNFNNKRVLDMGSGTGILSILSSKMGASMICAVDIDTWAYKNTIQNIEKNNCSNIEVLCGGFDTIKKKKFDIVCANINRNVLLKEFKNFEITLSKNGFLLLSGFYVKDNNVILDRALSSGFDLCQSLKKNKWSQLLFKKK